MNSIYLLIPLSLVLVGVAVWAFFWAVEHGQFEGLEDPAQAALEEDPLDADAKPPVE
jgi:cbb3-type cytochrome oxidase maturation protein